ncbi:MAG: hypothetical protein M1819_002097 [Sarea resinae]|nr:MAG: hypothetical protein M1819_002097 [Sarea resinae]
MPDDAPVPALGPDVAIVKTATVAMNSTDAKMPDHSAAAGTINRCDFTGIIVALGADALAHIAVGDRFESTVHGLN